MIIWLEKCLKCAWFYYCHETNFEDRPCKDKKMKDARLRGFELSCKYPEAPRSVILNILRKEGYEPTEWGLK